MYDLATGRFIPLGERPAGTFDITRCDVSPGRRLRAFAALVMTDSEKRLWTRAIVGGLGKLLDSEAGLTEAGVLRRCEDGQYEDALAHVPFIRYLSPDKPRLSAIPGGYTSARDPELAMCLQDLAYEITEDLREACNAFSDPDCFYPGVDEGIEPVTDEHVELVTWATQRELLRELRPSPDAQWGAPVLPAAPLAELPWRVQRAFAERRRLRYAQWGITRETWERGTFSVLDIPADPEYIPTRHRRLTDPESAQGRWLQEMGL